MQEHPYEPVPDDTDGDEDIADVQQLEDLISADRLLTRWARRPGPPDI
jgi:hypothetical protein